MQADLFGTKKNRPDIKSGELPIPTFTYHLPLRLNSKSSPNNIYKILPKFTNINVSLGKFVYRHTYSSEVYSYFLNLRYFRS